MAKKKLGGEQNGPSKKMSIFRKTSFFVLTVKIYLNCILMTDVNENLIYLVFQNQIGTI